ncbi:efflux RND transporter periplasmic adaptor subunit [Oryzomonas japonica]|uniref:Efflux RND transporter periplasmic adaptor subunit n=1 Tax=Oryzomonas japonica TaxID=2603858 RepID=A0A7J4ZTY5_9BACT|nr:efflux RND transporter periplasmic adaptor subunit [Oryzomonas japonica]KAB0666901.1 efflux RND transporter periplasmic adaptor subunit [Oryzomonas japonica]
MPSDSLDRLTIDKSRPSSHKRGAGKRTRLWVVVFAVIVAGVVLLAVQRRSVSIETTNVSQVFPTQSFTLLNASGYVVAQRKAAVAAKTTGRLEWLGVEEGSRVTTGQVIARLENKDLEAAVRQNEAAVQNARSALDQVKAELVDAKQAFLREKELLSQGIVARSEYDAAYARYKKAVAGVAGAEAGVHVALAALRGATVNYDYSLIRAPFDAVVLTKNADVGDIITPLGAAANAKAAVVSIADLGSLEVEADVSESNLSVVKAGQPCEVTLDALPNTRFRGVVHTIVPTADRTKASVMVKVRFVDTDPRILPEMSAKVAFLEREAHKADQRPRIAVKPSAIVASGGRQGVYLVTGDRVVFTPITRGAPLGDLVEVDGVKSGDKVALKPLDKLKDGVRIRLAGEK